MRSEDEIYKYLGDLYNLISHPDQSSEDRQISLGEAITDIEWAATKSEEEIIISRNNLRDLLYCPSVQQDPKREQSIKESISNLNWVLNY